MEETTFLKSYIRFFRYDKPHNSLPFFLMVAFSFVSLSNMFMAALTEKDVVLSLEAIKDTFGIMLLYICVIEHSLSPNRILSLIRLVEDELLNKHDSLDKEEKTEKIGMLHAKKKNMRKKFKIFSYVQIFIFSEYLSKNFLNYILGIRAYLNNGSKRWPTPFLYRLPEFQTSTFLLYIYALHSLTLAIVCTEAYIILTTICVTTERVMADFETIYILLDNFTDEFSGFVCDIEYENVIQSDMGVSQSKIAFKRIKFRKDMGRIVECHQKINRNLNICANNTAFVIVIAIAVIVSDSCCNVFFMLKTNDQKKAVIYTCIFIIENLTMFFFYQNGQRIFNQNELLRKNLAELPWTDKPRWFRQTIHIMMTRANVDSEMRPYGIFVLNYMSFKDVMKLTFSIGNLLYSLKLASQLQL